ncbi:MAG: hypothetical protein U0V73_00295 [Acidimicrobiia bacterium]
MDDERIHEISRRLRARAEPILGVVFHMPEAWNGYPDLGLDAVEGTLAGRASCLGAVSGYVAAAAFGVLEPTHVAKAIDSAWVKTAPDELWDRRLDAATRYLRALIGDEPAGVERAIEILMPVVEAGSVAGHPMFAGLCTMDWPDVPLGDLWHACNLLREHRGDSHVNAWSAAGLDPVEINVLSESWRGMLPDTITVHQLGWSRSEAAAARERLRVRGFLDRDHAMTAEGRALRDDIERATSRQQWTIVEALGGDVDELFALLEPWDHACDGAAPIAWRQPGA